MLALYGRLGSADEGGRAKAWAGGKGLVPLVIARELEKETGLAAPFLRRLFTQ